MSEDQDTLKARSAGLKREFSFAVSHFERSVVRYAQSAVMSGKNGVFIDRDIMLDKINEYREHILDIRSDLIKKWNALKVKEIELENREAAVAEAEAQINQYFLNTKEGL